MTPTTVGLFALGLCLWVFVQVVLHEAAHLLAARLLGFSPFAVTIGQGPLLFRRRLGSVEIQFHALPLHGMVWARPRLADPSWKGALFSIAGILSDIVLLAVLLHLSGWKLGVPEAGAAAADFFFALLALCQAVTIVVNLLPFELTVQGGKIATDGWQLLGFLRGRRPVALEAYERNVARYDPGFRLEDSSLMRCDVALLAAVIAAEQDAAGGRHGDAAEKYLRVIGQPDLHPAEKATFLDRIACIPLMQGEPSLLAAAEGWARQACELVPECRTVRGTLGAILVERQRYDDGLAMLMPLTSEDNTPVDRAMASCFVAKALHRLGRSAEGRTWIQAARSHGASVAMCSRIEAEMTTA